MLHRLEQKVEDNRYFFAMHVLIVIVHQIDVEFCEFNSFGGLPKQGQSLL